MHIYDVVGEDGVEHLYVSPLASEDVYALGALPREGIMGELLSREAANGGPIDPAQFRPNPVFQQFTSWVLAQHAHLAPGFEAAAKAQRTGYIYIIDARTATPQGAVPPEDIIGGVEIENGVAVRYHGSKNHQLLTSRGWMRLHPWMHAKLLEELRKLKR